MGLLQHLARSFSEFVTARRQLQSMGVLTIQHPRGITIPDFPDPVRRGRHLWFQYESPPIFAVIFFLTVAFRM